MLLRVPSNAVMTRRPVIFALALTAALVFFPVVAEGAARQVTSLFPGVTIESGVQFTPHGPVAIRIVTGPRPSGLYRLRPVLSNETLPGTEPLSAMQRRLAPEGTMVGVNGDFWTLADGHPNGVLMRSGILASRPNSDRSSLGVTGDGTLDVRRVRLFGTWRGTGPRRTLYSFNQPPTANGIGLYTPAWGGATPAFAGTEAAAVFESFPGTTANVELTAPVTALVQQPSVGIPPGGAVLVARGTSATRLLAEGQPGTTMAVRLILSPDWAAIVDAVGGGPELVRGGVPVFRSGEGFTTLQLQPRAPRTAVGQTADGRILLVTVDGRQPGYSVGMTNFELAQTLVRLGAVTAMALDSGGSTTAAFDGAVLNRPSDGRERSISTALMLVYSGIYALPLATEVLSPNGDGVGEVQRLAFKVVRPSTVTVSLLAPDGTVAFSETAPREPGTFDVPFPPPPPPPPEGGVPPPTPPLAEGSWAFTVTAQDDQVVPSSDARAFSLITTLGFLPVAPLRLSLTKTGGALAIRWAQSRDARVKVTIETLQGVVVRTVLQEARPAGEVSAAWDGRIRGGALAAAGRYRARVAATNEVGLVSLGRVFTVRRAA